MRNLEEALFWEIFYRHRTVRAQMARLFGVSAATISRSAGVLLAKKLVVETGAAISFRGRRPALLQVNPDAAMLAGLEIDRDLITAVVTDFSGNLLGRGATPANPASPVAKTLQNCSKALKKALADADVKPSRISRIGVGHTGTIDVENGLCVNWEGIAHWKYFDLRRALRDTFEMEISLDDRARAAALANHLLVPEHSGHRSAIYVHIGTGIGAAVFVNGRMLRGATLTGGELGHTVIDRNGPLCGCGRRGCVESFASRGATVDRVRQALQGNGNGARASLINSSEQITVDLIISAAKRGDSVAKGALDESGQALGIGIANAVQLLNPSLVVLVGKFANSARDFFLNAVRQAISTQCFETVARGLEIRVAPVRKDMAPVGCALLAAVDVAQQLVERALF